MGRILETATKKPTPKRSAAMKTGACGTPTDSAATTRPRTSTPKGYRIPTGGSAPKKPKPKENEEPVPGPSTRRESEYESSSIGEDAYTTAIEEEKRHLQRAKEQFLIERR